MVSQCFMGGGSIAKKSHHGCSHCHSNIYKFIFNMVIVIQLSMFTGFDFVTVCIPILVMTFPEWFSGTGPWPRTPGAVRPSSLCL